MRITVKLFATLRRTGVDEETLEFPPGTTAGHVMKALEIPEEQVTLIFVNGRHAQKSQELSDGDILALFPPIGGG
jgi:molybdopterin converting factor small subunit